MRIQLFRIRGHGLRERAEGGGGRSSGEEA